MNKIKNPRILGDILLILLGVVFFILGIRDAISYYESNKLTDGEKFYQEYKSVSAKDSKFIYLKAKDTKKILKEDNIVFIGNSLDSYSQVLAPVLNELNVEKIYYISINDKNKKNDELDKLKNDFDIDEITTPMIIKIKNNAVDHLYKNDLYEKEYDGILREYWNDEREKKLLKLLNE